MNINRKSLDLSRLATKLITGKWCLAPFYHTNLCKMVDAYMKGEISYTPKLALDNEPVTPSSEEFPISVVSLSGVLSKGVSEVEEMLLGMTDIDAFTSAMVEAAEDDTVKRIYVGFSSPGGECTGIEEAGRLIRNIDENIKPVYGWTESSSNSAAYWLMSQCRQIGMTPSANLGNIGVYSLIANTTEKMRREGISVEVFSSGKWKMMGHEFHTLTDSERKLLQRDVEKQHEKVKSFILSKRPQISPDNLEGLSYEGEDALSIGMCDQVHDNFYQYLAGTV